MIDDHLPILDNQVVGEVVKKTWNNPAMHKPSYTLRSFVAMDHGHPWPIYDARWWFSSSQTVELPEGNSLIKIDISK